MKHLLCAIDLSDQKDASKILKEADRLSDFYEARLSVVTVVPDYGSSWVGSFFKEGTLDLAAKAAMEALHKLTGETLDKGKHVQHIVEIGNSYEQILKTAENSDVDLIVVGAHKPDLTSRILGPNAARVARFATASVLVVRI